MQEAPDCKPFHSFCNRYLLVARVKKRQLGGVHQVRKVLHVVNLFLCNPAVR